MSKKNQESGILAEVTVYGNYRCKGPGCKKQITNLTQAIFTVRSGQAEGFCCTDCFFRATQGYIDEARADTVVKKRGNNLLTTMGFYERKTEEAEPAT